VANKIVFKTLNDVRFQKKYNNTRKKSDSVLSKTTIFLKKERRKREISNESARGSSLREANV